MREKKVKTIFWFFEWSWAAIYNWNSAKFQTFSMSNVPPQLDQQSQSRPQQLLNYTGEDQESQLEPGRPPSFFSDPGLISAEVTRSRCLLDWSLQSSLGVLRISESEHLWTLSLPIKLRSSLEQELAGGPSQVGAHQSKLSVMPNYNLISIGLCRSVPFSVLFLPLPHCLGHQNSVKVQHNWEELALVIVRSRTKYKLKQYET